MATSLPEQSETDPAPADSAMPTGAMPTNAAAPVKQATTASPTNDTMPRAKALSSMPHIIELADSLVHIADVLLARILQEILSHEGRTMRDAEQAAMRGLMDDELLLRQRAQALYADAATLVITGLNQPQSRLMALTAAAAEHIRRIGKIGEITSLIGGILGLAGAMATGQLSQVAAAIKKIHSHSKALAALEAPPTAS